jgi:glucose/arabinose dehydrogenase
MNISFAALSTRVSSLGLLALVACGGGGGDGNAGVPPTVILETPAPLATGLIGLISVSAVSSDRTGRSSVEFQIDGMPLGPPDTTPPYAVTVDTSLHASGQHVLRARASDAAGNVSAWSSAVVEFGGTVARPSGFVLEEGWISGLAGGAAIAEAPDGRLFVAQQGGAIRVVKDGVLLPTPFATVDVDSSGERGLIGIALHPDFAQNGHVYIYSTRTEGGTHNRISRLTAAGDVAAAGSEVALVDLPALSAEIHNGGALHFGVDGKLYVGVGDNGDGARAASLASPFGKLLRFNDDGTVPADNPFYASQSGLAQAIWAYGLRNPFTFAVQPGTGRIHVNDVGENTWEEINLGRAGANYGWPVFEGPYAVAGVEPPLFTYQHDLASPPGAPAGNLMTGPAIAGGAFYPAGGAFPDGYRDQYYFADFIGKFVARLDLDPDNGNAGYAFARLADRPVDLLVGSDGAVYVLTRSGITRIRAG